MVYTNEIIKKKNQKRDNIRNIIKIIVLPLIILLVLLSGYIGYMKYIQKEENISLFGYRAYIVLTGSMEPDYNRGDLVVIKEQPKENIKEGDVINYISENGKDTVTHRVKEIVKKDGQTVYKTKGDNNNTEDQSLVDYSKVQGTAVFKISKLGLIITKLVTGNGILLILILFFFSYIKTNRKEEKRIAREESRRLYNIPKYEKEDTV